MKPLLLIIMLCVAGCNAPKNECVITSWAGEKVKDSYCRILTYLGSNKQMNVDCLFNEYSRIREITCKVTNDTE